MTNDFPVFIANESQLNTQYLNWLSKTPEFVESCKKASEGTTNRVRLKDDRFRKIKILLPTPIEQRRIVSKIESLASKIEEAKQLRQSIQKIWMLCL